MTKDPAQQKLEALLAIRAAGANAGVSDLLRPYLSNRSNSVVAKAAAIAGELLFKELEPDLANAFDRLLRDGAKKDPQCTAKTAIAKALRDFETGNADLFFRGARHVQLEAVWGGRVDSAGHLRGTCAHALVGCRAATIHDIYLVLVDLLADDLSTVRAEAALALGRFEHPQSELLLRLKIRVGDAEPAVMGACFDALLNAAPESAFPFVAQFLDRDAAQLFEVASALGASRLPQAFELLLNAIRAKHPQSDTLLRCLAPKRFQPDLRCRVEEAVKAHGDDALQRTFAREFPTIMDHAR